jgi:Tol biopolymer transport system component
MGEVYRARDSRLGRAVALKIVDATLATDANRIRRFEQEAQAAGQLNHPNILAVHDTGVHAGVPYIVSELLEGETLRTRLSAGPMPPRKAIEIARQIAEGLAAAHDRGIVHRDVKPDNLFVTADGRVKILDFGIAKLTAPDESEGRTGVPTNTAAGTVVGTAHYMSPEQIRGEAVDARSDLFSLGIVLYEMLTGRAPFSRGTAADSMAATLKEEPANALPADVPAALARIVSRCLEKAREARFQSARDLAFGLDVLSGTHATPTPGRGETAWRWRAVLGATVVALSLLIGAVSWLTWGASRGFENPLAGSTFTQFTNFEGSELDAAISPDGRFVAFMADRDGPFHVWLKQVGTGSLTNLTPGAPDQRNAGPLRSVGFAADGAEIWINGTAGRRLAVLPLLGGVPRPFLREKTVNVAWSPDGTRLAFFTWDGDPLLVADSSGGNTRELLKPNPGDHNHFPAWSIDGRWIYFVHGSQSVAEYDIWRIPSAGGEPESLIELKTDVRYLTPIDARTILFVAPDQDRSGPWLWALDVERRATHRLNVGLDRYLSIAASADRRRLVASLARPTAALWSVPILTRLAEEADVKAISAPTPRAWAPRFGDGSLFYLSSGGGEDGLWRLRDGKSVEVWKGADGPLFEAAGVSPRGDRTAVVVTSQRKRQLVVVSADGAGHQSMAGAIDVRGTPSWSPDSEWIITGGSDAQGAGLFKIPVAGGAPTRLATGSAFDPVWSPDGTLIVYSALQTATAPLLAVRPDGTAVSLPGLRVPTGGGGRARFLPDGKGLVYLQGSVGKQDFWLLDLATMKSRRLTRLSNPAVTTTFDIAPDGSSIVFDRVREHSDIVLIDLKK